VCGLANRKDTLVCKVRFASGEPDKRARQERKSAAMDRAEELGLGDSYHVDPKDAVRDADLVVVSVPVGASGAVAQAIAPALKPGAILTDVGSTKGSVIAQMKPHIPAGVHFIPGHPVAGTEHSGPDAGFADLFDRAPEGALVFTRQAETGALVGLMTPDLREIDVDRTTVPVPGIVPPSFLTKKKMMPDITPAKG
jgi:hypothetical protein